ncbi:hypothetical protein [Nocardioides bruguierae]|uniref:hypothetical protein n=1 Tax=Nocardioides bruguierae TaxID=2945102 RepID=UPI002021CD4F|nr:hypothetical protein [Nocardioides bruguierae]MCL8026321.1 hypothetical protein [Nocardioides bruguierae]
MAHISLRIGGATPDDPRPARLVIDGVEITGSVLRDGFAIALAEGPDDRAVVSLRIRADRLDLDMPDAVLQAVAAAPTAPDQEA